MEYTCIVNEITGILHYIFHNKIIIIVNLPISHGTISWLNNECFLFLSFFQFATVTLECSISDIMCNLIKVFYLSVFKPEGTVIAGTA